MQTVPNIEQRDASWWRGYAQALKDFPDGVSETVRANRQTVADLVERIERGPQTPARPRLRAIRGGAA